MYKVPLCTRYCHSKFYKIAKRQTLEVETRPFSAWYRNKAVREQRNEYPTQPSPYPSQKGIWFEGELFHSLSLQSYFARVVPLLVARFSSVIKKFQVVPTFDARFVTVYKKNFPVPFNLCSSLCDIVHCYFKVVPYIMLIPKEIRE